jgi:hypothetical protein
MRRIGSCFALDHPLAVLALQNILHGHSGGRRAISLGLKVHLRGGFVLLKRDGTDADVHGQQIGTLRQVGHDTLPHGVLVLDVFITAGKQNHAQGSGRDEGGTNHISIIAAEGLGRRGSLSRKIFGPAEPNAVH